MSKQTLTLSGLERWFQMTEETATPHRTPDFGEIWWRVDGDPEVRGRMLFVEEHNTGYNGRLERWWFIVDGRDGRPVRFWADLLPGAVTV